MRHATAITSAADTVLDLVSFVGKYVTVYADTAVYYTQIPAAGSYSTSTSGAVAATTSAALIATPGACVPRRLAAATEKSIFVSRKFPRLMVRAQSTSTSYLEIKEDSDGLTV